MCLFKEARNQIHPLKKTKSVDNTSNWAVALSPGSWKCVGRDWRKRIEQLRKYCKHMCCCSFQLYILDNASFPYNNHISQKHSSWTHKFCVCVHRWSLLFVHVHAIFFSLSLSKLGYIWFTVSLPSGLVTLNQIQPTWRCYSIYIL